MIDKEKRRQFSLLLSVYLILFFRINDDFEDVLAVEHHIKGTVDLGKAEPVGHHTVEMKFLPVLFHEADAFLKVLLGIETIADQLYLLEGNFADDKRIGISGQPEGKQFASAPLFLHPTMTGQVCFTTPQRTLPSFLLPITCISSTA